LQAVVFTSQQSRFHLETLETPSKDLDISGIQLSVGDKKLLEDAQLRLFSGARTLLANLFDFQTLFDFTSTKRWRQKRSIWRLNFLFSIFTKLQGASFKGCFGMEDGKSL
jgi:hypothetical protein